MKKHRKILNLIFIFIILLLICYLISIKNNQNIFEDILFLKFFHNDKQQETKISDKQIQQYIFKVNYKNADSKTINLLETVDKQTLINKTLAPGIEGRFQLILETNKNTKYNITFQNKKPKPKNLMFECTDTKVQYDSLEKFNKQLTGSINKGKQKVINIHWFWNFENTTKGDKQDTIDSQNIKEYQFEVYVNGESVV